MIAALLFASAQEEPARLLERLRSDDIAEREAAVSGFKALGISGLATLRKGAKEADAEVAARSKALLGELVTEKLLREMPDLFDRAERRDDRAFADLYLRITRMGADPPLEGDDLAVLAGAAVRGAGNVDDRRFIIGRAVAWKQVSVLPEARKLMTDVSWEVRVSAVWAVGELGSKSDVPAIVKALEDRDAYVASQAILTLTALGIRDAWPKIAPLLDSKNYGAREAAIKAAGTLRIPEAAPRLLARLQTKDGGRAGAARSLAQLGFRDAVAPLTEMLSSEHEEERLASVEALVQLEARQTVDSIRRLLKDPRQPVRAKAAWALDQLK